MKKFLKLFLIIAVLAMSAIGLIACNEPQIETPPHEHTYEDTWSSDVTYHFKKASCEHTDLYIERAEHDIGTDNKCSICGYELEYTKGLEYELSILGTDYYVKSKGTATDIKNLIIPNYYEGKKVTIIGERAFNNEDDIETVVLPKYLEAIDKYAFGSCSSLRKITIFENFDRAYDYAFYYCKNLKEVEFLGTASDWAGISFSNYMANPIYCGDANIYINGELLTEATIDNSVGKNAFNNYKALKKVTFTSNVENISERAFSDCQNLLEVNFAEGLTTIGEHAFFCCYSLSEANLPNSVETIKKSAFSSSGIVKLTLGENLTKLYSGAFNECTRLVEIVNKSSLNIKDSSSYGPITSWALGVITNENDSKIIYQDDYIFYNDNGTYYLLCSTKEGVDLVLPSSVDGHSYKIYTSAFQFRNDIKTLVIPEGVTEIGSAFYSCSNLRSLTIGKDVTACLENFSTAYRLVEIINYSSVDIKAEGENFGQINRNHVLQVVDSKENSNFITQGDYIFYNANGQYYLIDYLGKETELILPESVNGNSYDIWMYSFKEATDITKIVVPEGVKNIYSGAFYRCINLKVLVLPKSLEKMEYPFNSCYKLFDIEYNGTKEEWGKIKINKSSVADYTVHCTDGDVEE